VPLTGGVICGAVVSLTTVIENGALASGGKNPLEAVTVKVNVPPAVGVPDRRPSAASVRPGGRLPPVTAYRAAGVPVAARSWL
jgi:hypothetical protein